VDLGDEGVDFRRLVVEQGGDGRCSEPGGSGNTRLRIISWEMFCIDPLAPVASRSNWKREPPEHEVRTMNSGTTRSTFGRMR
jgi:hypothetical protein